MLSSKVKVRSKEPYWLLRDGILNSYPALRNDISCDILVIGGGITGALMAYQFSSEGYETVVIDKRDIGMGSTCASTSMLQYELDVPLCRLAHMIGKKAAIDVYRGGVDAIRKLANILDNLNTRCGFSYKESLHFANSVRDAQTIRSEFECREQAGIKVKWLTKDQINSRYGIVCEGGILSETAASMDAYQLTHVLMDFAIKNLGLTVYDHVKMNSVKYKNDANLVITDTSARIECRYVVYATGYETHELLGDDTEIGDLISTYACISEPFTTLPQGLTQTVFWNTQDPYFYFRTTPDNRLLIGGEDEDFQNAETRDKLIEKKELALVRKLNKTLPGFDFVADFSWAGTFGSTKDSLPYIGGHPDIPRSYFMLGFGGNGMTFSIMGMEILSDAIAGRPNKFLEYFKFRR
jgi:glycine/D-amino acid oxidase-like deaminating enzyme